MYKKWNCIKNYVLIALNSMLSCILMSNVIIEIRHISACVFQTFVNWTAKLFEKAETLETLVLWPFHALYIFRKSQTFLFRNNFDNDIFGVICPDSEHRTHFAFLWPFEIILMCMCVCDSMWWKLYLGISLSNAIAIVTYICTYTGMIEVPIRTDWIGFNEEWKKRK